MTYINVAFSVDRAFLRQTAVVITSIRAHAKSPERLRFYIIHGRDDGAVSAEISTWGMTDVQAVPIANPFPALPGRIPNASMLRMLAPEALPHLDRVIYLNSDVVVLHDIAELYESNLEGRPLGAVVDIGMYLRLAREKAKRRDNLSSYFISLGFDPKVRHYVNGGVLLMDLAALRQLKLGAKAFQMSAEKAGRLRYGDQDIINAVLRDQITPLDRRWNVTATTAGLRRQPRYAPAELFAEWQALLGEQWLLHYTGPKKPWSSPLAWRADLWWQFAGPEWTRPRQTILSAWRRLLDTANAGPSRASKPTTT